MEFIRIYCLIAMALWVVTTAAVVRPALKHSAPGAVIAEAALEPDGTISGSVKLVGAPPGRKPINMSKEPDCAKLHAEPALSEEVIAGPGGALANVVVYISDGLGDRTFTAPSQPAVIEQKGCIYGPHVLAVQSRQPIRVINGDDTTHNIHPIPQNNREWNKSQPAGLTFEESFPREEIAVPVKCNIHPWMKAYIAVLKHPFFAVTSKDGSFALKDVPPGTYTIEAWHEKYDTTSKKVTVSPGQTQTIDFSFDARRTY